jgi:hypothetical protein
VTIIGGSLRQQAKAAQYRAIDFGVPPYVKSGTRTPSLYADLRLAAKACGLTVTDEITALNAWHAKTKILTDASTGLP